MQDTSIEDSGKNIKDLIEASSLGTPEAKALRAEGHRMARGAHPAIEDRLDVIARDLGAGYIDEAEAIERCREAGCTPANAVGHVNRWTGQ